MKINTQEKFFFCFPEVGLVLVFLFMFLLITSSVIAQAPFKENVYNASIYTKNPKKKLTGQLFELKENSLVLASNNSNNSNNSMILELREIKVEDLGSIVIRKKGRFWKSVGIGTGVGFSIGAIAGLASGDDPEGWFSLTAEEKAFMGGFLGAGVGAIIGTIVGLASKNYTIGGHKEKYGKNRKELEKYIQKYR